MMTTPVAAAESSARSAGLSQILSTAVILLALAVPLSATAQETSEEPWGYVYVFRTTRVYPLVSDDNRLGRLPENQIALTSPKVSRRHAAIRRSDAGVEFVDIGSTNGSRWNGESLRANSPVNLTAGDRIQLADELLLYHTSLDGLWREELRSRLLSGLIQLRMDLPQDVTRMSFGRERLELAITEVVLSADSEELEIDHSFPPGTEGGGFAKDTPAYIGNVALEDGVLELSLWFVEAGEGAMTSRRSSISNLKHTTLRVAVEDGGSDGGEARAGPWFPQHRLSPVFEIYSESRETSLRFATSLAEQTRAEALRDAAESLRFRYQLRPSELDFLVRAAQSKAKWVDEVVSSKMLSLTTMEIEELTKELEAGQAWVEEARERGADEDGVEEAADSIVRAAKRLVAVRDSKTPQG